MQNGWSNVQDSGGFISKMKRMGKTPEGSFLVTTGVVAPAYQPMKVFLL